MIDFCETGLWLILRGSLSYSKAKYVHSFLASSYGIKSILVDVWKIEKKCEVFNKNIWPCRHFFSFSISKSIDFIHQIDAERMILWTKIIFKNAMKIHKILLQHTWKKSEYNS